MDSIPAPSDWQRRRGDFNHQWLKNRFLSALDMAGHIIKGRIRGAPYLQDLLNRDIREWEERRDELGILLDDFESQMSPRRLFDLLPLANLEPKMKKPLSDLLHELWLVRNSVADRVKDAKNAGLEMNRHYEKLIELPAFDSQGKVSNEFAVEFELFRSACRVLSKALEKFPNRILVT